MCCTLLWREKRARPVIRGMGSVPRALGRGVVLPHRLREGLPVRTPQ